jgi:multidrug efflux pump subunit AcrA (membrane-fusion protein)
MDLQDPKVEVPAWQQKRPTGNWLQRNFWALATVIGVGIACFLVVHFFKKPGQLSVLESQAMNMSAMQPPAGAVPVAIMPVRESEIEGSVTYTGTVQAFEDEDVYPRITGRIVRMLVYPGDRVKKNQLLLELDPPNRSEYSEKASESQFAAEAAMHNAGIAEEELKQKRYELEAAKASQSASEDELKEAQANLDYWKPEIKRQEALLKTQVVSQQEYDDELAKFKGAEAKVRQLQARVLQAKNSKFAAQAALDGELHHVGHTALASKEANAAARTADIVDSYTRIVARSDGVVTKRLVSPGVVASPGMLILKVSHINKVRLQAEVASDDASRLSVGAPVYIKAAENSEQELKAKITSIFPAADASTRTLIVEALVDNIGPRLARAAHDAKDVQSLNDFRMLPGEYVVMRLGTGRKRALTIPSSAVVWREGKPSAWKAVGGDDSGNNNSTDNNSTDNNGTDNNGTDNNGTDNNGTGNNGTGNNGPGNNGPSRGSNGDDQAHTSGMASGSTGGGGIHKAELVPISIGLSDGNRTEVTSGFSAGDLVIYEGFSSLQNGAKVVGTEWGSEGLVKLPDSSQVTNNRLDAANQWTADRIVGSWKLHFSMTPQPPTANDNKIVCQLVQVKGQPVSGAQISAKTSMPTMSMAGPGLSAHEEKPGQYVLTSNFSAGLWQADIAVDSNGLKKEFTFEFEIP